MVEDIGDPVRDPAIPTFIPGTMEFITEAHRQQGLLRTGALQNAIFNSSNFLSIASDAAGTVQIFNVGAERMLGYAASEIVNKLTVAEISDPQEVIARAKTLSIEFQTPVASGIEALVLKASRGIEDIYELTYLRKDGTGFPAVVSVTALRDSRNVIIGYLWIGTDHTARKQAEAARRTSEARYRTLFEYAPDGIIIADPESRYLDANASMCRMLGYTPEELIGLHASDIVEQREVQHIGPALTLIKTKSDYRREWQFRRKDGSVFAADVVATTMPDNNLLAMIHDITERKRIEARLRRLVDSNAQGVMFWNAKGEIVQANDAFLRIVGHTRQDLEAGRIDWAAMTPAEFGEVDRLGMKELAANGVCTPYEKEYIRKDGSYVPVISGAATFEDSPDEGVCFVLDITSRKQVEDEQRRLDQRLRDQQFYTRSLIESNIDALITTNPLGVITDVNKQMEALTGCTRDELIGAPFRNCFTDPGRAQAGIRLVLNEKKVTNYELTARDRDGKETVVSYNATTFYDRDRRLQGVFGAARDITAQRECEEALREVTQKAEQASRIKSEFLANMSHEIRTPMNVVIGLSYLLGRTGLDDEQAELLAKIKIASKSLTALINDVLDLSKIEAGELMVERAAFSPRNLLRELADVMKVQADAKGIGFEIDAPHDLPAALEGDATRLNQILTNLLSNAIKFTERGGVKLHVRRIVNALKGVTLSFIVRDTGIGIAPEVLSLLFAPFSQADASITRRFGGTGLGLSIVKRLANLMGGEVDLDSTPGVGSEFRVVLNFVLASSKALAEQESSPTAPGEHPLLGLRLLVVDDSDVNLDVTKRILELEGAHVSVAGNGQEAFERLRAEPEAFDMVLMDVQMPVLDGNAATRRIRMELGLVDLPILALTAGALSSERQKAADAGMDNFIVKPFGAEALVRCILSHVKGASCRLAPAIDGAPERPPQPVKRWPEIEGIDSADVRARMSGDVDMFGAMLDRLIHEFSDVASSPVTDDPVTLAGHARRMHKLRGSAGMLGAKGIQHLAGEAEAACAAGEIERVAHLVTRLASQLQRLGQSAAPALAATKARAARVEGTAPTGDGELEPQLLVDLIALLRQQNLSAMDRFTAITPQLQQRLGQESYALVSGHVNNLQFGDAVRILEEARP